MRAVKENKEYTVSEAEKDYYASKGYDIYDGEEKVVSGKGKTISYDEYIRVVKENETLKAELEALKQDNPNEEADKKTAKKNAKE